MVGGGSLGTHEGFRFSGEPLDAHTHTNHARGSRTSIFAARSTSRSPLRARAQEGQHGVRESGGAQGGGGVKCAR